MSKFIVAMLSCALLALPAALLRSAERPAHSPTAAGQGSRIRSAVDRLVEQNILSTKSDWASELAGDKIPGDTVAALLLQLARHYNPSATPGNAIALLAERQVIGRAEYWTENAVAGRACDSVKVETLLTRVAGGLSTARPRSAGAAPLEPIKPGDVKGKYDLVIAGAGTGGCGVAIEAARMGCSVLLIDETDYIGGQMNAAAVTSMDEGVTLVRERGLYRELCANISAWYQPLGINPITAYFRGHYCCEPHVGRQILLRMLGDARGAGTLDLLLDSRVTKVAKTGDTVTGVSIQTDSPDAPAGKSTRGVSCKILVDATEWGDVIPLVGARYRAGNSLSDNINSKCHIQDLTWTAVIRKYPHGVPENLRLTAPPPGYDLSVKAFRKSLELGEPNELGKPTPGKPWTWARFIAYRGMPDTPAGAGQRAITRTHMNFNNDFPVTVADLEDPASRLAPCRAAIVKTLNLLYYVQHDLGRSDWSVADDEGYDTPFNRRQMDALIDGRPELKPYREILYRFSIMAYARESRRIVGLHTLTAREIERVPGRPIQFPHTIALGDYAVDLHGSMTSEYLEPDLDRPQDIPHKFGERGLGPFAIPFECFIPEKVDGFLPSEKNVSQSRLANGATRLQPSTLNMGQAVGVIAALAVHHGIQPRAVEPAEAQRALLDAGATLSIAPVKAPWGTAEWKEEQLQTLDRAGSGAR